MRRGSSARPSAGSRSTTRTRRCCTRSASSASAQQLWGKAQTYLEASLALDDAYRTHVALGELLARLGRNDEANAHLAAALKLALAELGAAEIR